MHDWTLQHVSVWLEDASSNESAFNHALEWAFRLNLPLRVAAITQPPVSDRIKSWGEKCALRGVALETHLTTARTQGAVEHFLKPHGLCVFSDSADAHTEQDLLQRSARIPTLCQLLSAGATAPIGRVLILCRDTDLCVKYLESAARICQALETTPIILILAKTEYDAELKHEYAEGIFNASRMLVDVDFVIDREPRQAVSRIASWRRCSHVIVPRAADTLDSQVRELSATVSVLTVPINLSLDLPGRIRSGRGILSANRFEQIEPITAPV